MDNLPNELLHLIISFNDSTIKYLSYGSCKLLNSFHILLPIQVCNYYKYDGSRKNFWIHRAFVTDKIITKLPNSIKRIMIGNNFDGLSDVNSFDILPSSLTYIEFGYYFNKSIDHLPSTLKKIIFGDYFNQQVDNLPKLLKKIVFGKQFNQNVNNLPLGMTYIEFGEYFNKSVDHLPVSLISIVFGSSFDLAIDNLPRSIKKLSLSNYIYSIVDLPLLTHLTLGQYNHNIPNRIKLTLTHLYNLNNNLTTFPLNVYRVSFARYFNKEVNLPDGILYVKFQGLFNRLINNLPDSIKYLDIAGPYFNQIISKYPLNLTRIYFGNGFNQSIDNLSNIVTHVKFGNKFDQKIGNSINITHLKFSSAYIHDINHLVNLVYLKMSRNTFLLCNFSKLASLIIPYMTIDFNDQPLPALKKLKCYIVKNSVGVTHLCVDHFDKIPSSVKYLKTLKKHENMIPRSVKYVKFY